MDGTNIAKRQTIFWNEFADLVSSILCELGDLHLDPRDPVLHLCLELPQEEPRPGAQVHHSPAGLPPPPPHRAQAPPDQTCQGCFTMLGMEAFEKMLKLCALCESFNLYWFLKI